MEINLLFLRENLGSVFKVEVVDVFCSIDWSVVLVWCSKHGGHQPTCACSCYYVKIICYSCFCSIQRLTNITHFIFTNFLIQTEKKKKGYIYVKSICLYLKLGFKKGQDSARNDAPNATSIDAQHCNLVSLWKITCRH